MVLIRDGLFRYRKRSSNAISETFLRRLVLKTAGLVQPGGVENKYTTETQVRATGDPPCPLARPGRKASAMSLPSRFFSALSRHTASLTVISFSGARASVLETSDFPQPFSINALRT